MYEKGNAGLKESKLKVQMNDLGRGGSIALILDRAN